MAADHPPALPASAEQRLRELAGTEGALFTSTLSVNEWALGHSAGVEPIAQVMGSSVYHVGWQNQWFSSGWSQAGRTEELAVLSEAWNESRRRALSRLEQEARLVGAHAVVGVDVRRGDHDWAPDAVEWVVTGTAVRLPGAPPTDRPVLSDLSGQDFSLLARAGCRPVGIVAASTVVYVVSGRASRNAMSGGLFGSGWRNQELADYTQGVYDARELALARINRQAQELGADGVVGVHIDQHHRLRRVGSDSNERIDLVITFHVLGTAIEETPARAPLDAVPILTVTEV